MNYVPRFMTAKQVREFYLKPQEISTVDSVPSEKGQPMLLAYPTDLPNEIDLEAHSIETIIAFIAKAHGIDPFEAISNRSSNTLEFLCQGEIIRALYLRGEHSRMIQKITGMNTRDVYMAIRYPTSKARDQWRRFRRGHRVLPGDWRSQKVLTFGIRQNIQTSYLHWTDEELEILYRFKSPYLAFEKLEGRSLSAIATRMQAMGIIRASQFRELFIGDDGKRLTAAERGDKNPLRCEVRGLGDVPEAGASRAA